MDKHLRHLLVNLHMFLVDPGMLRDVTYMYQDQKLIKGALNPGAECWNSIPFKVRTEGSTDKFCKIFIASFLHDVTSDETNYRANSQFDLFHTSNIHELEQI